MKNVMGVIYTGEKDSFLRELTLLRAIAAMPVAGRYRVIDFLVSSMVGSGMRNVGVIMQKNYHSLMDHLGSGKEWDLHGGAAVLFSDYARVIHNGVSDAVNGGRERIVDEADMQVFHDMLLSDGFSGASRRENARQPFSALRILR